MCQGQIHIYNLKGLLSNYDTLGKVGNWGEAVPLYLILPPLGYVSILTVFTYF